MASPEIDLTIVVPAFNEEDSLAELVQRVEKVVHECGLEQGHEIIFVDDGSTDGTRAVIEKLSAVHPFVRGVVLRTNLGKSIALMAGFLRARGRMVVTMDADLQDNPEDIPRLIDKLEHYDVISGWRQKRHDTIFRKLGSKVFNIVLRLISGLDVHDQNCGFKIFRVDAVKMLMVYGQFHRLIPLQAHLLGFRVGELPVKNSDRKYGRSKFHALRYQGLFDLLSLLFTFKYALSPLHFFGIVSLLLLVPSTLALCYLLGTHLLFLLGVGDQLKLLNRPMLSISLTVFLAGVGVLMTGFVCDFILHHHARSNMDLIMRLSVLSDIEAGKVAVEPPSPVARANAAQIR